MRIRAYALRLWVYKSNVIVQAMLHATRWVRARGLIDGGPGEYAIDLRTAGIVMLGSAAYGRRGIEAAVIRHRFVEAEAQRLGHMRPVGRVVGPRRPPLERAGRHATWVRVGPYLGEVV